MVYYADVALSVTFRRPDGALLGIEPRREAAWIDPPKGY